MFRNDVGNRSLLCVSAQSEDPAICAATGDPAFVSIIFSASTSLTILYCASTAPHYLALSEKVELCSGTPMNRGQDAVKCLAAVEGASKAFKKGPKKALGYFLDSLWDARYFETQL